MSTQCPAAPTTSKRASRSARGERGHLGRHPAAKTEPDKARILDPQIGEEPLVERGDVARVAHPLRPLLDPETGVAWHDHVEFVGERVIEREALRGADIVV